MSGVGFAALPADVVEALAGHFTDRARWDEPLAPFTTYRVGGPASVLVEVHEVADLDAVHRAGRGHEVPVLVVGNGSNLLVADAGFPGIALRLGGSLAEVTVDGRKVRAGGAALLPVVARRTAGAGLTGFEWAVGVPGSIGGAVRMNAGGHGSDMAATLVSVGLFDLSRGGIEQVPVARLELGYRRSSVIATQVVVWADMHLEVGSRDEAEAEIADIVRWRREHQPGGANAGSVFTNPSDDSAGRLVEAAGAKGRRRGGATVSPKHANFIQVAPGAAAQDVFDLMVEVRQQVWEHAGVVLEPETRLVGFEPLPPVASGTSPSGSDR